MLERPKSCMLSSSEMERWSWDSGEPGIRVEDKGSQNKNETYARGPFILLERSGQD